MYFLCPRQQLLGSWVSRTYLLTYLLSRPLELRFFSIVARLSELGLLCL